MPHDQLSALYLCVLQSEHRYDELWELLNRYQPPRDGEAESEAAAAVRAILNERVRIWLDRPIVPMDTDDVSKWRRLLVENQISLAAPMRSRSAGWN